MTQIFIFTAGNSSARSHLDDSIINPIDFKKVEISLDKTQIEKLLTSNNEKNIFCWGAIIDSFLDVLGKFIVTI